MNELISIIVPVFNTAPYLKRCIESILRQSYQNFELLLIDDGSTDESSIICDHYAKQDQRIKVFHQENAGVCAARNVGLDKMKGSCFVLLDSDDALDFNVIEMCYKRIVQDNSDVAIFGRREIENSKIINSDIYGNGVLNDSIDVIRKILADRHIYGGGYPNKMWRTTAFIKKGEMIPKYNLNLFYVEDMEWIIRMMLQVGKISLLDNVFYNYYLRDDSVSRSKEDQERRLIGYHDSMEQIVGDLSCIPNVQYWFAGVYYSELINSTLDAYLKQQRNVYMKLFQKIEQNRYEIWNCSFVSIKCKIRLLILWLILYWRR